MCGDNVYLDKEGKDEPLLEAVYLHSTGGGDVAPEKHFGEQKVLKSTFKVLALSEHNTLLKEADRVGQEGIRENRRRI